MMHQDKGHVAFRLLQITFIIVPILAGLDKFFHILIPDWSIYLSPEMSAMVKIDKIHFMYIVGVIEVIAGLGVIFKPRIFAFIVSLWLLLIIINLIMTGHYYDIALRDLGLMLSAFSLGLLGQKYED